MPFPIIPLVAGGIAAAGAINSAVQGGKQNDLNEEALRLERLREVDRQMMRNMFMERAMNAPTPEQHRYDAAQLAQQGFAGSQNPFARPQADLGARPQGWVSSPRPDALAARDMAQAGRELIHPGGATPEEQARNRLKAIAGMGANVLKAVGPAVTSIAKRKEDAQRAVMGKRNQPVAETTGYKRWAPKATSAPKPISKADQDVVNWLRKKRGK